MMLIRTMNFFLYAFLLLVVPVLSQQDYSCSPSKPCKLGCCGKNNVCGLGPNYCAPANCTSNCDSKSECDPGWGSQWSQRQKCPLNVCCSQFGFCGTTKEFCGDKKVTAPSCPGGTSANKKIIGYYEGWSMSKACNGIQPENLLYTAYTHLNYAFAFIDPTSFRIANMQDTDEKFMPRLTALKNYNPGLQIWIAIGGWSMNDPDQSTKRTFSQLAASAANQRTFFSSLLSFMDKYGFDGVDIDWEYPVAPERSGAPEDFANFVSFLKNLRGALGSRGLSITLPSSYWYLQNFDIKNIAPMIDWFNMMSYDLHGTWDGTNPYLGPYVRAHTNLTEIDQALDLLWRNDIDPAKVVLGTGFYGRSFTLSNPGCKAPGCGFSAGGKPGRCSSSAGTLMFNEIQEIVANGAQVTTDQAAGVKIVTWDNDQWVSYDDESTLKVKMDYANGKCLGGVMVWAASTDDYQGTAIRALAKAAGRTDLVSKPLAAKSNNDPGQCVWGECGASCPSGLVPVETSSTNNSPLGIEAGCKQGKRYFCCPAKDPPRCEWKGKPHFCGMFASNRCNDTHIEVAASTDGCWTGHKSLCCEKKETTKTINACKWMGAAPICATGASLSVALGFFAPVLSAAFSFQSYGCPEKDKPYEVTKSKQGEGGQQSCMYNGGFKSYCCPSKTDPWDVNDCKWRTGHTTWVQWEKVLFGPLLGLAFNTDCKTGCEPGETTVATDGFGCRSGTYSYFCCGKPSTPTLPDLPEISLCPGPPTKGLIPDPEANQPNVFLEPDPLSNVCEPPPTARTNQTLVRADPLSTKSSNVNSTVTRRSYDDDYTLYERSLVKRGAREKAMALCGPNGQAGRIWTQNHPGAPTVLRGTLKAFTVAKSGVCAALGITALTTLDQKADWVTEHVFEKQEFRDAVQYMTSGKTPTGNAITVGAAPFAGVFDNFGLFQNNWPSPNYPSLSFVSNWAGNINDIFTGILGRTADSGVPDNKYMVNLQVCDSDFNKYKEYIAVAKTFISSTEFNLYNPLDRIGVLSDVLDTFAYRSEDTVVTSYQKTYSSLYTLWGDFSRYARTQGVVYDFAAAWKQVMPDFLTKQVSTAKGTFLTYLNGEIAYWGSTVAKNSYSPQVVKSNLDKLVDWKTNIDTLISLPISKMTA